MSIYHLNKNYMDDTGVLIAGEYKRIDDKLVPSERTESEELPLEEASGLFDEHMVYIYDDDEEDDDLE